MEKSVLEELVSHHIRKVDKYYRMFAGLESTLTQMEEETLFITIKANHKWKKDPVTTASQLANDWRSFNPELSHAKKYLVKIIPIAGPTGFSFSLKQINQSDQIQNDIENLRQRDEALEESNQYAIEIFGVFEDYI